MQPLTPASYRLTRFAFLRRLGLIDLVAYRYRFAESGQRELLGECLRPLSLDDPDFATYLRAHGFEAALVPDSI